MFICCIFSYFYVCTPVFKEGFSILFQLIFLFNFSLSKHTTVVGRNRNNVDFLLDSSSYKVSQYISRLHARIIRTDTGRFRIFDDSLNGIFLNSSKIQGLNLFLLIILIIFILFLRVSRHWSLVKVKNRLSFFINPLQLVYLRVVFANF